MPGLSGLQLQQKLEILEREIPIIFVTGHGDVDMAVLLSLTPKSLGPQSALGFN